MSPPGNNRIGIRLLGEPVKLKTDPRARECIIDCCTGTTISRRIEVSNGTTSRLRATMYSAAAAITAGAFIGSAGHSANDMSSWNTMSQGIPDIPRPSVPAVTAYPQDSDVNHLVLITPVSLGVLLLITELLSLVWRRNLKGNDKTQRLQPSR